MCNSADRSNKVALTGVMGHGRQYTHDCLSGQAWYEISSGEKRLKSRYRGIQEFEIVPTCQNMTKYAVMITDPKAIRRELMKAINIAMMAEEDLYGLIAYDIQNARWM